jgi:uncharacterized protein
MARHHEFTMSTLSLPSPNTPFQRKPRWLHAAAAGATALRAWASLDAQQRRWIFQARRNPSSAAAEARDPGDLWIEFDPPEADAPARLHARWLAQPQADAPVLLYLHGARCDLPGSAERMQRLNELGFAVLGIDYRGFGLSTAAIATSTCRRPRGSR